MHKKIAVYDNSISARTYLSYIAEQAGGFACIGRDGKLYIKTIGEDITELPLKYFQKFKWGEKFKISRVRYEDGIQLFEKGDTTDNTVYINQENIYIVEQEQIDNIYNQLNGLEVYSFEGDSIIDPSIDIGDILIIDGKKVIYQGCMQYSGKFKANISSKIQSKSQEETTTRIPSQKVINRRVQSQIDQAEGKITLLATKAESLESSIDYFSVDLAQYNLTIPTDSNHKPLETKNYEINYYGYFKGKQITPDVSISGSNAGIIASSTSTYLRFAVANDTAIDNASNEFSITFNYTVDETKHTITKKVNIALALQGEDGADGTNGKDGQDGAKGQDGKSAYQIWLDNGNTGTEEDYLASLKGEKGDQRRARDTRITRHSRRKGRTRCEWK